MRLLPIAALAAVVMTPALKADKFHFSTQADNQKLAAGSSLDVIHGVLLGEENGLYHIRVQGGEMWVSKALVKEIEKDGLTVADVEKMEKDDAARLAKAEQERSQLMTAEVAMARERNAVPAEASATRSEPAPAPTLPGDVFDPVLGVVPMSDAQLALYLRQMYAETGDRAYLKQMRLLRRY